MFSIRAAKAQDAAPIAHVHVQSWLTTYRNIVPQEYLATLNEAAHALAWQGWLSKDIIVYVAEAEGKVVGFAGGGAIREPTHAYDAELYTLYLLEDVQGHGLGKMLLRAVMDELKRRGYRSMLVWVLAQNPAVHFYERAGAQPVASKQIEIGDLPLPEVALGWQSLNTGQPFSK